MSRRFSARARALTGFSLVVVGLGGGNRLLDILKREMQLVRIKLLRAGAKLRALQLPQQMLQANILRLQVIALRNHGVVLGARFQKERLQRCDIGWQRIGALAHANHGIRFARRCNQVMHR